ncbi:MAG TPA: maleylpyruvate isomerase N-terminal domain-containing protein [Jiangellales bacterium]|nr:maleylpyruvate isomerase N-terminal domain-containing protein [Jiangellales bacterium]
MHTSTDPGHDVCQALVRQWAVLAAAIPRLDLTAPTRLPGWTNRELVAHLAAQPALLARFLADDPPRRAEMSLADNLAGTAALAARIDIAARHAADAGRLDFAGSVERVLPALWDADPTRAVVTLQGPIDLADYLVTRCIEAVVHGLDLVPPVAPDPAAAAIAAGALLRLLSHRAPHLVAAAAALDQVIWLEAATGRRDLTGPLGRAVPLLT